MKKVKLSIIVSYIIIQFISLVIPITSVQADIAEGDTITLQGDHKCDPLLEYWMTDYQRWSYKVVWYVYYQDKETNQKYPAFCIEPKKNGIGTGYDSYQATLSKEQDNGIWRILNKGYMGSSYTDWNLECDDDFYTATKVALHSFVEKIRPIDKYILGTRVADGNSVEEIQRRATKVLEVAQTLYDYGLTGKETYQKPKITIQEKGEQKRQKIDGEDYLVQEYVVQANAKLVSYEVSIQQFVSGTKILNSSNQEKKSFTNSNFKIAIPIQNIKKNFEGNISVSNAQVKTNPIYYCTSSIQEAQNYVTYCTGIENTQVETKIQVEVNPSTLWINKIDKETQEPIANVTFQIKGEDGKEIGQFTTNQSGNIELKNVVPQTVTIKEIDVPDGYVLSDEVKTVTLEWGKMTKVVLENTKKKGDLKIVKLDGEEEKPLEKVEFDLIDAQGNIVTHMITDEKGEATVKNLNIGNYILRETKTQEGYQIAEDKEIKIAWKELLTEVVENVKKKGKIQVYKVDKEDRNIPIPDVVFEIRDKEGKVIDTITTDEYGSAISKELPIGEYTLVETKTNEAYALSKQTIVVNVKEKEITEITIENEKKKGKIEIVKRDKEENTIPLEGVAFEIKNEQGVLVDTVITDKTGRAYSKELPIGEYHIEEIQTKENYVLQEEIYTIIVEENQISSIQIENKKIKGRIEITKIAKEDNERNGKKAGEPISNVKFEIYDEEKKLIETIQTDNEGKAYSSLLEKGVYFIKEIETDKDYLLTEELLEIEITEEGELVSVIVENASKEIEKLPRTGF